MNNDFVAFPKIPRLSREIIITEKIDGTNACIRITDDGIITAGSRSRWITPADDNYGFAAWVQENSEELMGLGVGTHYGEWWGAGIQRKYGVSSKRFSLFNTSRWGENRPSCCGVVPVLYTGVFDSLAVETVIEMLRKNGSMAAPGFMKPEGVVVYHTAGNSFFKKMLEHDEERKRKPV